MEYEEISKHNNTSYIDTEGFMYMTGNGHYESVKGILQTYVVPFIIITGFFGNTISFLVFVASPLKRISTSVYLAALAFSDTGFLFCLGIGWLESLGITFFHKEGICQITVYASFVFSFTSIWFVNAFTLEMYSAVFLPRKSPKLCTPAKARQVVGIFSIIAGLIYIYAFWIAKVVVRPDVQREVCEIVQEDEQTAMILSVVDTLLTLVVPFTMIIFMIVRLLIHVTRFYKSELESLPNSTVSETYNGSSDQTSGGNSNQTARQANEAHTKLTRMLVVTVIVFLVLNVPSHAIKLQYLLRSLFSQIQFTETEGFIQVIFQILYYSNFSVNFLLYSACGKSFRAAMMRISINLGQNLCRGLWKGAVDKIIKTNNKEQQRDSNGNATIEGNQPHSRLVDIHLDEIRFSQLPSIESQFVCKSPPCLLAFESEQLLEEPNNV